MTPNFGPDRLDLILAGKLARDDGNLVVAAGEDGTVDEVPNGLFEDGVPRFQIAMLPLGTANDFATSAGIPNYDATAALRLVVNGGALHVDMGRMSRRPF